KKTLNEINGAIVLGDSLRYIYDGLVEDIYVVPNCVDDEYLLGSLEEKNTSEPYHILYLSNFIRTKGYEIVLRMAKQYKEHPGNKKLHYDFAGKFFSDEEKQFFTTYIKKNNLDDVITYHGVVSGTEKKELLKTSTFFILPTNYPKEGQPISILEAMGNGAVILTTNHAGIPDVVVNKENGCVLPWSEKLGNDYLEYINTLNSKEIEKIQQNNYNAVKGKYLETTYINNLDNTFKKAMSLSLGGNKE
ncbi:MAG: glycosyltransferase, partial [Ruminococcus sp.]|nr:glycosyltransferase [Ruminococcus sp.]